MSILMLITHYLDYYIFVVTFEIAMCEFSFFVPFLGLLWLLEAPAIPYEFLHQLVSFIKESGCDSDGDQVESVNQFGECCLTT